MQQGQLTCHFYYCLWLRPPKGTFAKTPRRSGIGTFGTALWLWGGALTGRSAVIELVPPAVSASQREERRPKLHWEERQLGGGGGASPCAGITAMTVRFRGAFSFLPTPPVPQKLT